MRLCIQGRRTVKEFFDTRHHGRYRLYNLCAEKTYDAAKCARVRTAKRGLHSALHTPLHAWPVACAQRGHESPHTRRGRAPARARKASNDSAREAAPVRTSPP